MFQSSSDILNISIALAVLGVSVFLCIFLYRLIENLRRVSVISKKLESISTNAEELVSSLKSKVKQSSSYVFLLTRLAEKAMDYFSQNKKEKKENKESKKKD